MPHHRAPRTPARSRRALAFESLEPRAVPAGLAQIVEIDIDDSISAYDAVHENGAGLLIAARNGQSASIGRLNNHGQHVGTIELAPAAGYGRAQIDDLSEDGNWALGSSIASIIENDEFRSVTTLWRLSDPSSPIALPPVTGDDDLLDGRSDLSNQGTFFTWTKQGRLFLVSPTGFQELSFPPGTSPVQPGYNRFGYLNAITPDGRTFVGSLRVPPPPSPPPVTSGTLEIIGVQSGIGDPQPVPRPPYWYLDIYQAAVWRDGQPTLLQVDPTHISSLANAVSDDGRLIGGAVLPENSGHIAAVWFDGQLRTLTTASGEPMRGTVGHMINGIGGDPSRWLVFGTSYDHDIPEVTFVADETGVAQPLGEWLRENYGLQGDLKALTLTDALLADGLLRLFSTEYGLEPPLLDCPACLAPVTLVRTGALMITIDLQAPSLDVDADGHIAPSDALLVIDALNAQIAAGIHDGSLPPGPNSARLDVSRDGFLTAADALLIINRLNSTAVTLIPVEVQLFSEEQGSDNPAAEGESSPTSDSPELSAVAADLLFQDLATPRRTRAGLCV